MHASAHLQARCHSLIRITKLEMIAARPPVVMPDEKMLCTVLGNWLRISGTSSTLKPSEKLMAMTKVALRLIVCEAMMRMPAAATVPNISKVAPPNTGEGMSENTMPTAGNTPSSTNMPAMK